MNYTKAKCKCMNLTGDQSEQLRSTVSQLDSCDGCGWRRGRSARDRLTPDENGGHFRYLEWRRGLSTGWTACERSCILSDWPKHSALVLLKRMQSSSSFLMTLFITSPRNVEPRKKQGGNGPIDQHAGLHDFVSHNLLLISILLNYYVIVTLCPLNAEWPFLGVKISSALTPRHFSAGGKCFCAHKILDILRAATPLTSTSGSGRACPGWARSATRRGMGTGTRA